mmetsp:Transcript_101295/g.201266  ORF Transcript_101295/g.201266 Transcript_101295/m.201266 type:complete len:875 (+) Transcript_101295:142-2766(+)
MVARLTFFFVGVTFAYPRFVAWASRIPANEEIVSVSSDVFVQKRRGRQATLRLPHGPPPEFAQLVKVAEGMREMSSRNRGTFAYLGDNASVHLMNTAEEYSVELLHAAGVARGSLSARQDLIERSRSLLDILYPVKPEHEWLDAAKQYVPIMSFVDANFARLRQTCSGETLDKPIYGVSREGCATACDVKDDGCIGFSYYGNDDRSLCFLFSKFSSVTYYPECEALDLRASMLGGQRGRDGLFGVKGEAGALELRASTFGGQRGVVKVSKWECDSKDALPFQSTTTESGITRIESLNIGTGKYKEVLEIPKSWTVPAFRSINSCAINPRDGILHCSMEINNKGSFLVRIDKTQVAFVTKLPGWRYAATFDDHGNYYLYGNSGLSVIADVTNMPSYEDLHDLRPQEEFTHPKDVPMGADLVPLTKDLENNGIHTYLLSVQDTNLHVVRVSTTPWKHWELHCEGKGLEPRPLTWGSAWSFGGKYYFAPDSGEGVHELDIESIKLVDGGTGRVKLNWVSPAQVTDWNDGFNCFSGHDPFDPDYMKEWDCSKQPRALQVTTTHLTVPTTPKSKSYVEYLNIEEGKYELLFEIQKSWTDPPFNCINSCSISPKDNIIHCTMEIDNRGSFLVRIDDTKVGYVAKVPGWQYAGIFDSKGNYYMYGNSGISVMNFVNILPTKKSYLELGHEQHYNGPHSMQMGADLAVLETAELEGKSETYLLAVESSHLHIARVTELPLKQWKLWGYGLPQSESAITWGSAWNFDGGIFFAPDSAEGVFQLLTNTIDLQQKNARFVKVGNSQKTNWNDGFSCSQNISPFSFSLLDKSQPQAKAPTVRAFADVQSKHEAHKAPEHVQCMAKLSRFQVSKPPIANVSRAAFCF